MDNVLLEIVVGVDEFVSRKLGYFCEDWLWTTARRRKTNGYWLVYSTT